MRYLVTRLVRCDENAEHDSNERREGHLAGWQSIAVGYAKYGDADDIGVAPNGRAYWVADTRLFREPVELVFTETRDSCTSATAADVNEGLVRTYARKVCWRPCGRMQRSQCFTGLDRLKGSTVGAAATSQILFPGKNLEKLKGVL